MVLCVAIPKSLWQCTAIQHLLYKDIAKRIELEKKKHVLVGKEIGNFFGSYDSSLRQGRKKNCQVLIRCASVIKKFST